MPELTPEQIAKLELARAECASIVGGDLEWQAFSELQDAARNAQEQITEVLRELRERP